LSRGLHLQDETLATGATGYGLGSEHVAHILGTGYQLTHHVQSLIRIWHMSPYSRSHLTPRRFVPSSPSMFRTHILILATRSKR